MLVHCKGGLGCAGLVASRLLVELGWEADAAIAAVRGTRPGAIETPAQAAHVRGRTAMPEPRPARDAAAVRDRARGALLGLAVGDAVGTTLEFHSRGSFAPLTDMVGGGPFRLLAGEWTDDTAMALALADALLDPEATALLEGFDAAGLMRRFVGWWRRGEWSCTGECFDIGNTVRAALSRFECGGAPFAGSTAPDTAGNGSLMRLAPVALRFFHDRARMRRAATDQSRCTHAAPEAVDACVIFAELLADAIVGTPKSEVLRPRLDADLAGGVGAVAAGRWRGRRAAEVRGSGYVVEALEAALWAVGRAGDFREAVLLAANLGDDADTTAAIAGQLAGALHGERGIPAEWLAKLAWRERISALADGLVDVAITDGAGANR